jgi:RNA polymerase sigma factor (sigma-70 family)
MSDKMPSEAELLGACVKGDTAAFEAIVGKYQSLVCAITYGATADLEQSEELAHEVFIKVWTNLSQLQDLSKFRAWLYAIIQNVIRNYYRSKKRDIVGKARPLEEKEGIASESFKGTEAIIDKEQQAVIRQALEQIPEKYRTPLVLFYRQGQSIREVAEMLELSEETVKTQISRGRKMLKEEVAAMVETTISRTGPSKAFTAGVIASVAGLAIKGSAAAAGAATIASGKAAILSGVTAKIIAAAAVVIIGVGAAVAYKQLNRQERPYLPKAEFATQKHEKQSGEMEDISAKAANKTEESKPSKTETNKEIYSKQDNTHDNFDNYIKIKKQGTKTGIEGFVIDKSTSKPITGAKILYGPGGAMDLKCLTDANGHFECLDMQPQKQQWIYIIAKDYTSRKITLDIIKDKVYEYFKIELMPGSKAAGVVYDPNGKPIKGATVRTFEFYSPAVTDANGTFEIDGLDPAWGHYTLCVTHPNYPSLSVFFTPANAGETVWQDVVLKSGITIYGQVTDEDGVPVSGVTVGTTRDRCMWNSVQAKTDSEGRYELNNVDVQHGLVLWAVDNTHAPYVEDVNNSPLPDKMLKNIRLADSVPLHGKIVDKEGNPVSGVSVSLREYKGVSGISVGEPNQWITSDSQGRFTIRNVPPEGKVILEVYADFIGGITMPEVEAGQEEEYIIEVERSGRIYGSVVGDSTDEPVRRFNVKINSSKTEPFKGGYEATWSREGHYFDSAEGFFDTGRATLAVGAEYSVTIYADGFNPLTIDPVEAQPISDKPNRTEFRLKSATGITGRVVDSNGAAISGARVRIMPNSRDLEHWDDRDTAVTNSNGEFYLPGLGRQEQLIYITAETYGTYLGSSADLPKDSNGAIQITLERGAEVSGRVFTSDGNAAADAIVYVIIFNVELSEKFPNSSNLIMQTTTDANGYYEVYDLPAGSFFISANSAEGNLRIANKEITLKAGQHLEVNFGDDEGFAITGTVRAGEKLLEKAEVEIRLTDEYVKWSYTNSNGRFKIAGIPKGTYNVIITYYSGLNPKTLQWGPGESFTNRKLVTVDGDVELEIDLGDVSSKGENPQQLPSRGAAEQ